MFSCFNACPPPCCTLPEHCHASSATVHPQCCGQILVGGCQCICKPCETPMCVCECLDKTDLDVSVKITARGFISFISKKAPNIGGELPVTVQPAPQQPDPQPPVPELSNESQIIV